ncbi:MAG: type II secretion system F family protein [Clostridia bacterium]
MLALSSALGIALLLLFLPAAFRPGGGKQSGLHDRIEVEQQAQFRSSFEGNRRQLPGLDRLRSNPELVQRLSRYVGLDSRQIKARLERLRWDATLEEVLLAKLVCAGFLAASLLYLHTMIRTGQEVGMIQLLPVIAAAAAFLFPTQLIEWADKRAKQEIQQQIPIFFGIVQALVEAGMPVHSAVKATARRYPSRLGKELAWLEVEEKQYGNWRKALEAMAYRWEIEGLITIALEINEAMTKGVSIARLLAEQVEEQLKQQEDEAAATMNRLQVRLLPLLIVFMGLPLMFLVMGPAFIGIGKSL